MNYEIIPENYVFQTTNVPEKAEINFSFNKLCYSRNLFAFYSHTISTELSTKLIRHQE